MDLLTGIQIWSFNMGADAGINTNLVSTAALVGNDVIVAYATYLYDFNATTGADVWRSAALPGPLILSSPSVSGAPGDQVAFIGDLSGNENGYRLSDGALVFSLATGHKLFSSAAISDGMVFFGSGSGYLYALG